MLGKIYIASDHAGFELKEFIIKTLSDPRPLVDLGTDSSEKSVDYPDFAKNLSSNLVDGLDLGILICGSGIGMSIAANRYKHIRAALCNEPDLAKLAKQHNNANVLCLGSRFISQDQAIVIIKSFLNKEFELGRHETRVQKLS